MGSTNVLRYIPRRDIESGVIPKGTEDLIDGVSFDVDTILNKEGKIDFDILVRFLEQKNRSITEFFEEKGYKKERMENILFPFFDFLKQTYFSKNHSIPNNIITILRENTAVLDGIISYIEDRNPQIISNKQDWSLQDASFRYNEQFNSLTFHFFLLGMSQEFEIDKDVHSNHYNHIKVLFADFTSSVIKSLGVLNTWSNTTTPPELVRELYHCIELGETINKLALIYWVKSEERHISMNLGEIIRNNIDTLLRQLPADFIANHAVGKKLRYLSGKVKCNFAHGEVIDGTTIPKIQQQVSQIKEDQQAGFDLQESADFGCDILSKDEYALRLSKLTGEDRSALERYQKEQKENFEAEYESSFLILIGNDAIAVLSGICQMEKFQKKIPEIVLNEKKTHLHNLTTIYNHGIVNKTSTTQEIVDDFVQGGIKNENQIEVIYYIVLFDNTISLTSLARLINFFLEKNKGVDNFFYEEFAIKIINQIIRKLHTSPGRLSFLPIIEKTYMALENKNISDSVLSYSRVYLSLALYYIECNDEQYVELAITCFLHYKNLIASPIRINEISNNTKDEKDFYVALGKIDEERRYGKQNHADMELERGGMDVCMQAADRYQKDSIMTIHNEVNQLIATMTTKDGVFSQDEFNNTLGKLIAEDIFYKLAIVTIIGDCDHCSTDQNNSVCEMSKQSPTTRVHTCPIVPKRRGFESVSIHLEGDKFIVITYPSISKQIIEKIFAEQGELIRECFGNPIAVNNKNFIIQKSYDLLQKSQAELKKLAFYDSDIGLPNENRLKEDIRGKEKTLALLEIAGYDKMMATQDGGDHWIGIVKMVAAYLQERTHSTIYLYDKKALCIVFDTDKLEQDGVIADKKTAGDYITSCIIKILSDFHHEHGKDLQFYTGVIESQNKEHLKFAHVALARARMVRENAIYVFKEGDEKVPEDERESTKKLLAALNINVYDTEITPHYQIIYDPKNPTALKLEALARIEYIQNGGKKEIIGPHKFIDIAIFKRLLPDIAIIMIDQVVNDMIKYPNIHVSINMHEQDWNDTRIMKKFIDLKKQGVIDFSRLSIEILEMVKFDRDEDREKIKIFKQLGCKISIDDYGQDRGNLKKIIATQPDNIKLDEWVVKALGNPELSVGAAAAIRAVVYHAGLIGATVTAEFIETMETFLHLQKLGVNLFQGYLFAKPVPIEEAMSVK